MLKSQKGTLLLSGVFLAVSAIAVSAAGQDIAANICAAEIHEESVKLDDYRHDVDLARSNYESYLKIFKMIESLHEGNTIPRMDYVKARFNRDATKLELEKAGLVVERQAALVEQYRLACGMSEAKKQETGRAIRKVYLEYHRSDCDSLAKGAEVAATNLEYNREYLKSIKDLRKENQATQTQVILAELDVELEEKNLADEERRAASCRVEQEELEAGIK